MTIQRYDINWWDETEEESSIGEWCKYEDVERFESGAALDRAASEVTIARLQNEVEQLQREIAWLRDQCERFHKPA